MKKSMFRIILFVALVQAVFIIINVGALLSEAVIPFKPAKEAVMHYKPAPRWPSLREHLIFFVRHLLEYKSSPESIDIIFQESTVREFLILERLIGV